MEYLLSSEAYILINVKAVYIFRQVKRKIPITNGLKLEYIQVKDIRSE